MAGEGIAFKCLDRSDYLGLEVPFADGLEKIFSMLVSLGRDKALGPSGFILAFWHISWVLRVRWWVFFREFCKTNFSENSYFWGWFLKRVEHKT